MTRQIISTGTAANDGTGDTLRNAATKINSNFHEIYTFMGDSSTLSRGVSLTDSSVTWEGSVADNHETRLAAVNPTADRLIELPNASGIIVLKDTTDTLTNKTLTSPVLTTPQINDAAADHQYIIAVSNLAADRTITLPLLTGADEFTFNAHTQTLTKKTLSAPTINTPKITGDILDSNGVEIITLSSVGGGATNEVTIANSNNALGPGLSVTGTPADTNLRVNAAGTGSVLTSKLAILSYIADSNGAGATNGFKNAGYIIGNKSGSPLALALVDGTTIGELKTFTNKGSGGVMSVTPSNYAQGTEFSINQNDSCVQCIWDGTNWNRM